MQSIGAFKGQWSNLLSQTSLKNKKFYLFEANEDNEEFLKRYNFNYFIKVLSDKEKEVEFYGHSATGDSYFLEQTSVYKNDKKVKIKNATTLDKVIEKEKIPFPNFIKIDTQGSELDILKGAKEGISNCSFFLTSLIRCISLCSGMTTINLDPTPSVDSTFISPLIRSTKRLTMVKPNPVPS